MDVDHSAVLERLGVTYDVLLDFKGKERIGTELLLASIVIYVYDILTTFGLEVQFVWMVKPRVTLAKMLFALTRYLPLAGFILRFIYFTYQTPANPLCNLPMVWSYLAVIIFVTVELVLMLRIWVLYGRSKRVGIFMGIFFLVAIGAELALRNMQPPVVVHGVFTLPVTVTICRRSSPSEIFWGYLFGAILEMITFSLLLNKVYITWRSQITSPIIDALLNHGSLYYLTVISMFVFAIVSTTTNVLFWPIMDSDIAICISCVACNHLVLSLRGLYFTNHIYSDNSKVAPTLDGGHDFHSPKTHIEYLGGQPADPFTMTCGQVPTSSTLGEEEISAMR